MPQLVRMDGRPGGLIVGTAGVCRATSPSEASVDRVLEDGSARNQEDGTRRATE